MIAARYPHISLDTYLARERESAEKHEYLDGLVYMMAGASVTHVRITSNTSRSLGNQLADRPCDVFSSDMRVRTPSGLVAYPDVVVVCGEPYLQDDRGDVLLNPVVVIEVLSPSTEEYDRTTKFDHYRTIPWLKEYVLIAQEVRRIERRSRIDIEWEVTVIDDPDGRIDLAPIGCTLALADVYARVQF